MPFEKWLAQEKYDEADRRVQGEPAAASDNAEREESDVRRKHDSVDASEVAEAARAIRCAAIEISAHRNVELHVREARIEKRGGDTWLALKTDGGDVAVLTEGGSGRASHQEEGQAHLGRLADACGVAINEPEDLRGCTFMIADGTFAAAEAV